MAINEELLASYRQWTPENREKLAQFYLGRPYQGPDDIDLIMGAVNQSLAGKTPGTRDSTGMFSVPDPNATTHIAGKLITAAALGGVGAGELGLFGGTSGATAGSAPATAEGVNAAFGGSATGGGGGGLAGAGGLAAGVAPAASEFSIAGANPGMGLGGQATTGLGLQGFGGAAQAPALGASEFGLGAGGTTGGMGLGGGATGYGVGGAAAVPQAGGGGGFWQTLFGGAGAGAAGQTAGGMLGGGLLQAATNLYAADQFGKSADKSAALSDPFASQRPFYQNELQKSYTDPNYFTSNPVFQGLQNSAANDTNARMAAMGYNMSGNQMHELTKSAADTGFKYAQPFQAQLAQNAGAGISPGYAGYLSQQGANLATNAKVGAAGAATTAGKGAIDLMNLGGMLS